MALLYDADFRYGLRGRTAMVHSRAGLGYRVNPAGVVEPRRADEPRFDRGPDGTLAYLGEGAATNQLLQSHSHESSTWAKGGSGTVTVTDIPSPFPGHFARRISPDPSTTIGVRQVFLSGVNMNGRKWRRAVWLRGEGSNIGKILRLSIRAESGTLAGQSLNVTLTASWQRHFLPVWTGASDSTGIDVRFRNDTGGDATSCLVANDQVEESEVASSDIITTTTATTRPADILYAPWTTTPQEITAGGGATFLVDMVDRGALQPIGAARRIVMTGPGNVTNPAEALHVVGVTAGDELWTWVRTGGTNYTREIPLATLASQIGDRWRFFSRILVESGQWRVRLDYTRPNGTHVVGTASSLFTPPATFTGAGGEGVDVRLNLLSRGDGVNAANTGLRRVRMAEGGTISPQAIQTMRF